MADWTPAIDVQENEAEYLVKADLPDIKKDDVKITIDDGVLSMEGERKQEKEEQTKKFHKVERVYGKFVRRSGLVYPQWNPTVFKVRVPDIPKHWLRVVSILQS